MKLCVQAFGRRDGPAVLLIGGASRSMDWWDIGFCERLAEATGGLVIRYDHRDTGESTWYPPGSPDYTFADLAADPIAILDALGLARAHLVGLSMGGQLAQVAALHEPGRVASLTLIATSPEPRAPDLPPTTGPLQTHFDTAVPPDWADRAAVIDYVVAQDRAYASDWPPQEGAVTRERAAAVCDRTACVQASHTNHYAMRGHARWRDRLGTLNMPTLVLHGTRDPLFTIEHGIALAAEIPGARLLPLPDRPRTPSPQLGHRDPRDRHPHHPIDEPKGPPMTHRTGTRDERLTASHALLEREKQHSRNGDHLARLRRDLPWVPVTKD